MSVLIAKTIPPVCRAGPQVLLQQLNLPRAAVVEQCLRDLGGGAVGERDQQRIGVLAPAGQVHRADDLAGDRVADQRGGAAEILQMLGVMLVTEHVRRLAAFQRRADAIGAGELLGIAEARQQLNAVKVPLEIAIGRQPVKQHAARIGQHDADRLALEIVAQVPQHRQGVAGQRGVQAGTADRRQAEAIGGDMPRPAAPPRRQDRITHPARPGRLTRQETLPGLGQPGICHLWPDDSSARPASPACHHHRRGLGCGTSGLSRVRGTANATRTARMMTGPGHALLR